MKKYIVLKCTLLGTLVGAVAAYIIITSEGTGIVYNLIYWTSWSEAFFGFFSNINTSPTSSEGAAIALVAVILIQCFVVYSLYGFLVGLFLKSRSN